MYQRCMFGNHDLVLKEANPQLVEHAFGRIKIIRGRAVTVMGEPFVSKAVENYFAAIDPYFAREVRKRMVKSSPIEQGFSAPKIEDHAKTFRKYCPENVYISMIVAHPTKWTDNLPASSELPKDPSGVQQVVISVSDDNFGAIFPKEHVEFIDRLQNARKRSADDDDTNDGDCSKKVEEQIFHCSLL
ncbi:hypothetical protein B0O80DRAFT_431395 [Mortierella sp. GBAus27b]|nr:hypothetical protein B0O80DRAFT_431395 [Mortierella sp. GBAus27b]